MPPPGSRRRQAGYRASSPRGRSREGIVYSRIAAAGTRAGAGVRRIQSLVGREHGLQGVDGALSRLLATASLWVPGTSGIDATIQPSLCPCRESTRSVPLIPTMLAPPVAGATPAVPAAADERLHGNPNRPQATATSRSSLPDSRDKTRAIVCTFVCTARFRGHVSGEFAALSRACFVGIIIRVSGVRVPPPASPRRSRKWRFCKENRAPQRVCANRYEPLRS
jgi:hypothetical protein